MIPKKKFQKEYYWIEKKETVFFIFFFQEIVSGFGRMKERICCTNVEHEMFDILSFISKRTNVQRLMFEPLCPVPDARKTHKTRARYFFCILSWLLLLFFI